MVSPGQGRIGRRLAAILAARIRRREVIALLGGAAIIWPIAVSAEQATVPLVGLLTPRATGEDPHLLAAFREGLKGAAMSRVKTWRSNTALRKINITGCRHS